MSYAAYSTRNLIGQKPLPPPTLSGQLRFLRGLGSLGDGQSDALDSGVDPGTVNTLMALGASDAQLEALASGQTDVPSLMARLQLTVAPGDNCSGFSSTNVSFNQILGLSAAAGETGVGIAATAGAISSAVAGAVTLGVGAVVGVIATVFAHHAAKVKEQSQLDCAAVAAANNSWSEIQQAIAGGSVTDAATAYQLFETVYSQFAQYEAQMANTAQGKCNGPCGLTFVCRAVTDKFEALYGLS